MVYTVTLNPALDYVLHVGKMQSEDVVRASSANIYSGGKGTNVSIVLHRLGVETAATGFCAGFTGEKFKDLLTDEGIDHDFVDLALGETRINVKISGERELHVNAAGPAATEDDLRRVIERLRRAKEGDFIVLSGSLPDGMPEDAYGEIMSRFEGRGVRFIVDAAKGALRAALGHRPFLIKPNHVELGELFGKEASDNDEIISMAKELQGAGASRVLVSMAHRGAILVDDGKVYRAPAVEGKLINSAGCGDSMIAGFIAEYQKSGDGEEALRFGTAAGCASAFCDSLPRAEEIEKYYKVIKNELH